jgi:hypothetical protein
MSDSPSATVIVIDLVLTISANGELELLLLVEDDDELEPPRLPAVVPPVVPPVVEVEEEPLPAALDVEALDVDPADTVSPGERLESDTIVPLIGAYSFVSESAVLALLTLASALYTAAWAEATVPAGEVELLPADEPLPDELLPDEPLPDEPLPDAPELGGVVVFGAVVVCFGAVVVVVVVFGGGVVVVVVVVWVVGFVTVSDTNCVVPVTEAVFRLAVVVLEAALVSAVVRLSCAAVRFCSA